MGTVSTGKDDSTVTSADREKVSDVKSDEAPSKEAKRRPQREATFKDYMVSHGTVRAR